MYEDSGFAMLKTHYYGGVKKFQWVTLPLAIHGVVCKKDGSTVTLNIGEDINDPDNEPIKKTIDFEAIMKRKNLYEKEIVVSLWLYHTK